MTRNSTTTNFDRERIINSYINGSSVGEIARIMGLKRTTVHEIIKKYQTTGLIECEKRGGYNDKKLTQEQQNTIKSWVDDNCTLTLRSIVNLVLQNFEIQISKSTINRIISGFNYSLKRIHLIPERRNDERTIEIRKIYAEKFITLPVRYSENQYIYIDEVGFNVSMRSSYGRSEIGSPANHVIPNLRSRNISICCAINKQGILFYSTRITAFNKESFKEFISTLITVLKNKNMNKAVLIMDNVQFHKNIEIRNLIEAENYELLFLPPYSPFLNPIENMFSKWKEITKRSNPQTEQDLMSAIENGAGLISEEDCDGYFRNMFSYIPRSLNSETIED